MTTLVYFCSFFRVFNLIPKKSNFAFFFGSPHPGIMDGAFFVSRSELLDWLNNLLSLNYTKVEQVGRNDENK